MFKKVLGYIFSICLCYSTFLNCAEYQVKQLFDIFDFESKFNVITINDKGQILGRCQEITNNGRRSGPNKIFLFDKKNGITFIEAKDNYLDASLLNNAGQVVGTNPQPFIWNKSLGVHWLNIPNSRSVHIIDLNDLGQIIGSYQPNNNDRSASSRGQQQPFIWDNGVVTDMGIDSDFANHFRDLGYHVRHIKLDGINNKGELVGRFWHGKYHEKKKRFITVGYQYFFWNGELHLLPLSIHDVELIKLNNKGRILISTKEDKTYLWDIENGLESIPEFVGLSFNDSSVILGYKLEDKTKLRKKHIEFSYDMIHYTRAKSIYDNYFSFSFHGHEKNCLSCAIWREGKIISLSELLGVDDIDHLSIPYSDTYSIEGIEVISKINNQGQIPCNGIIWGDYYPCILEQVISKH